MHDLGPSPEDIERLSSDTGYCSACGAEIWDQAEFCPECGEHLGGHTMRRPPVEEWFRQRWIILVSITVLIAFLILFLNL